MKFPVSRVNTIVIELVIVNCKRFKGALEKLHIKAYSTIENFLASREAHTVRFSNVITLLLLTIDKLFPSCVNDKIAHVDPISQQRK